MEDLTKAGNSEIDFTSVDAVPPAVEPLPPLGKQIQASDLRGKLPLPGVDRPEL